MATPPVSTVRPRIRLHRLLLVLAALATAVALAPAAPATGDTGEIDVVRGVVFASPDGLPQRMDLYLPSDADGPAPVLLWLHGGGWANGDRNRIPGHIVDFARRGYAVVSAEYRLSHEAIYPAQIHDVKAAIRWLRAHADTYGLDGDHIAAMGSSAGSHLAALAGTTTGVDRLEGTVGGHLDESSRVQAIVDGYAPTDLAKIDEHALPGGRTFNHADSVASRLVGCALPDCPDDVLRDANPAAFASSDDPPFLIVHGTDDLAVGPKQSQLLHDALAEQCVTSRLILVHGQGHSLFLRQQLFAQPPHDVTVSTTTRCSPPATSSGPPATYDTIEAFLERHLVDE